MRTDRFPPVAIRSPFSVSFWAVSTTSFLNEWYGLSAGFWPFRAISSRWRPVSELVSRLDMVPFILAYLDGVKINRAGATEDEEAAVPPRRLEERPHRSGSRNPLHGRALRSESAQGRSE